MPSLWRVTKMLMAAFRQHVLGAISLHRLAGSIRKIERQLFEAHRKRKLQTLT